MGRLKVGAAAGLRVQLLRRPCRLDQEHVRASISRCPLLPLASAKPASHWEGVVCGEIDAHGGLSRALTWKGPVAQPGSRKSLIVASSHEQGGVIFRHRLVGSSRTRSSGCRRRLRTAGHGEQRRADHAAGLNWRHPHGEGDLDLREAGCTAPSPVPHDPMQMKPAQLCRSTRRPR